MPTSKPQHHRRGIVGEKNGEKNRKGRLAEKALSFHAGTSVGNVGETMLLPRPRTVPDLISGKQVVDKKSSPDVEFRPPKLTKLLLNVNIQGSLGAVQVLMSPEATVEDLIAAALRQYSKEGRRSILPSTEAARFDLHYSQFSLESLHREEKLMALGSRNFFLCPKKMCGAESKEDTSSSSSSSTSSCSKEAGKAVKIGIPWLKFMEFLL